MSVGGVSSPAPSAGGVAAVPAKKSSTGSLLLLGARRWRRARRITQIVALLLFTYLVVATTRRGTAFLPGDLFLRFDPLASLAAQIGGRQILARLLPAVLTFASALVVGRAWCGWICPLGTTLDYVTPHRQRRQADEPPAAWRATKYVLLFAIICAALFGNLTLMILDPITIIGRTIITAIMPALNAAVTGAETALYPISALQRPLNWIESTFRGNVLAPTQPYYQVNVLLALVFAGILALNWLAPRFWCRYLCPLGALLALPARFAFWRARSAGSCTRCGACARECPTGAIVSKHGFEIDERECVMCMDCPLECPELSVRFGVGKQLQAARSYDPSRRQALAALGLSVAGIALLRSEPAARRDSQWLVRPPGARETAFLSTCIRCGACVKVCPTSVLQPGGLGMGIEGAWSPVLVTRLGYCDYSCNACGQVCPTGAIPPLPLEQKRVKVIGVAEINKNRCLPWAATRNCIVCEEMCPVAPKAVVLDDIEAPGAQGEMVTVRRPRVISERCIGCGICEYQCPLDGPAAIRVNAPHQFTPAEVSAT
jgi:MauM/NapG family ferredoxin protein